MAPGRTSRVAHASRSRSVSSRAACRRWPGCEAGRRAARGWRSVSASRCRGIDRASPQDTGRSPWLCRPLSGSGSAHTDPSAFPAASTWPGTGALPVAASDSTVRNCQPAGQRLVVSATAVEDARPSESQATARALVATATVVRLLIGCSPFAGVAAVVKASIIRSAGIAAVSTGGGAGPTMAAPSGEPGCVGTRHKCPLWSGVPPVAVGTTRCPR